MDDRRRATAKPPTVYDVASAAGVSIATVSRVFRRPDEVTDQTRAKVLAAVQDLGYVPSGSLLEDLRVQLGMSMLYITHDLLSARVVTDRIMVLHEGRVVEEGGTADVLRFPTDPYTVALLDAVPQPSRAGGGA